MRPAALPRVLGSLLFVSAWGAGLAVAVLGEVAMAAEAVTVVESKGVVPAGPARAPAGGLPIEEFSSRAADRAARTTAAAQNAATSMAVDASRQVRSIDAGRGTSAVRDIQLIEEENGGGERAPGDLFYQLQELREEIRELRGVVEEQGYRIRRLDAEQKNRYIDIDRRLQGVGGTNTGGGGAAGRQDGSSGRLVVEGPTDGRSQSGLPAGGNDREAAAYAAAFELNRKQAFGPAIDAFEKLLVDFPNGDYSPNALFWLGELYLVLKQPNVEKARQAFVQVVTLHPKHPKVPDAMYRLATLYDRLGDQAKAREYLTRVKVEHADTPAARLAANYEQRFR